MSAHYPVSLLACGHWQPTESVATVVPEDLTGEVCRQLLMLQPGRLRTDWIWF